MRLIWLFGVILVQITIIHSEYTIRDRIKLHKAWLEGRALLKAQDGINNSTRQLYYFNKLLANLKLNTSKPNAIPSRKPKKLKSNQNEVILDGDSTVESPTYPTTTEPITTISDYTTVYPITSPFQITSLATPTSDVPVTRNYNVTVHNDFMHKKNKTMKSRRKQIIWSGWHSWTNCSRTCGSGVMSQRRDCIRLLPNENGSGNRTTVISKECIGLSKRYRLCNEQNCPDPDVDFRQLQCMEYNNQTFQGTQYEWEAYVKDDAECELNCKPVGLSYFATLNERVVDGTSCFKPSEYLKLRRNHAGKAICVDGICKVIHSNGVITGSFMNNGAVRCGDLICHPITGLFSKNPLPTGYVHVATIPAGSSNISITELKNSMNLLALSYSDEDRPIINGDYYSVSLSGIYEAAGATFDYQRIDGITNSSSLGYRKLEGVTEWITCTGRITEAIQLKVLVKEKNPGIKYEYLLPISGNFDSNSDEVNYDYTSAETEQPPLTTVSGSTNRHTLKSGTITANPMNITRERRKRRFMWKVVDFHPCNKSCGGGIQMPIYHCVKEGPSKRFVPRRCAHLPKPILSDSVLKCNTQPCPGYWKISEWSSCQCAINNDTGFQKREIKCVEELNTGMVLQIPNGACLEDKPDGRQLCECPKNKHDTYKYRVSQNGLNSIKYRGHHSKTAILNDDNNNNLTNRPDFIHKFKKSGIWLTSEYIEQCSAECGDGVQYRSIFCDRSPPNTDRCDIRLTPDTTRQCTSTCDNGYWFLGSWSQCSGDCFNLTQTRTIYCIKNGYIVDDVNCEGKLRPIGTQQCNISQVPDCGPSWHYSEWSECSKPCGTGSQRRTIKCLSYDPNNGEMKESDNCKHKKRKRASQACNLHSCDTTTEKIPDPRVDLIQNDIAPECKDELPNCLFAVKQQLCNWPYIKEQCCETCFYK